jgi:hypothetical protein
VQAEYPPSGQHEHRHEPVNKEWLATTAASRDDQPRNHRDGEKHAES